MRYDSNMDGFTLPNFGSIGDLVRAEYLAYARFETAFSHKYDGLIDLVFSDGRRIAVVPWLMIDGLMLLEAEVSPIIWPTPALALDPDVVDAIECRIEPWLRGRVIARFENAGDDRYFTNDPSLRELVGFAREQGWVGATASAQVLLDIAPHVYAVRFAKDARVLVAGRGAANGGALLAREASSIAIELDDDAVVQRAKQWFGIDAFTKSRPAACDLYVGPRRSVESRTAVFLDEPADDAEVRIPIATPLPIEITVSFDLDDAAEAGAFAVRAVPRPARPSHVSVPAPTGGSGGRIALVAREDILRARDSDTEAVVSLHAMLAAEGFNAEITTPSHFHAEAYDLVHVFGWRFARAIRDEIASAVERDRPVVWTPYADDPSGELLAGLVTLPKLLQSSTDEILRYEYLEALARRRLVHDEPLPDFASDAIELAKAARVAFVTCPREEEHLRNRFKFTGQGLVLPAVASGTNTTEDATWVTGYSDFVLLASPIAPAANVYLAARGAIRAQLPFIVCGDVVDAAYYTALRAVLGRQGMWVPAGSLSEEARRSLFARAKVTVDVPWAGTGLQRLATAACAGSAIVASSSGYAADVWAESVCLADPASEESIAAAILRAWEMSDEDRRRLAARTATVADPLTVLVSTVAGYQQAAKVTAVS